MTSSVRLVKLAGEVVSGRYRVEHLIGAGGMGSVWKVRHVESLQSFALKTLHAEYAEDRRRLVRFLREVRAAAALNTRHVARVVDAEMSYEHHGKPLPYFVMEYLKGETLSSLCARHGLTAGEVVWVVDQIVRALRLAHGSGIVHRDLKPSNVFLALAEDDEPVIKLCDFGVAKLASTAEPGTAATRTGDVLGTPLYMAPEQLRGSSEQTSAVDQWALGMIAFRMVAGRDFFEGVTSSADLVAEALSPALSPASARGEVPAGFDAWFARSCARNAEERWHDVEEQRVALVALLGSPEPSVIVPRHDEADVSPPSDPALTSTAHAGGAVVDVADTGARQRAASSSRWLVAYTVGVLATIAAGTLALGRSLVATPAAGTFSWPAASEMGASPSAPAAATPPSPSVTERPGRTHHAAGDTSSANGAPATATTSTPSAAPATARTSTPRVSTATARGVSRAPTPKKPTTAPGPEASAKSVASSTASGATPPAPSRAPRAQAGAACRRSAECASGLCLARVCQ